MDEDEKKLGSIRQMCDAKIRKFRDLDSLTAVEVAKEVVELSSLWASVQKKLIDVEMRYNTLMRDLLIEHKTASKAHVFGKASKAYEDFLEATAYSKSIQELIRTGKRYVSMNEAIERESKY